MDLVEQPQIEPQAEPQVELVPEPEPEPSYNSFTPHPHYSYTPIQESDQMIQLSIIDNEPTYDNDKQPGIDDNDNINIINSLKLTEDNIKKLSYRNRSNFKPDDWECFTEENMKTLRFNFYDKKDMKASFI